MRRLPGTAAIAITVTLMLGRGGPGALSAADQPADQAAVLPSLDPYMQLQHYAPRWTVDVSGATAYVLTPGAPPTPDRFGNPAHLVVAFPPLVESSSHTPLRTLASAGPFAWLPLLINGGRDCASLTDIDLYGQRFGWDVTESGLITRLRLPVATADRRASLERLLVVRLLQERSTPGGRAALASVSDPADPDLTAALSTTPVVTPDPIPWITTLPLHDAMVVVWQPGCYPALPEGLTAMRILNALSDIIYADRSRTAPQHMLFEDSRLNDRCCLLPFEFARTYGNCRITRAVMSCDLTLADLVDMAGPPIPTSYAIEGHGLQAIARGAQAFGVGAGPDQAGQAAAEWRVTATDTALRATYLQAPAGVQPASAAWGALGLDATALLWIRLSGAALAGLPPNPILTMLALGPDDDLVVRIGMTGGNTVVSLSAPAHGAAGMQALASWTAAMITAAHQQQPNPRNMINPQVLVDLFRIPQPVVATTGDRAVISWTLPGALLQGELPFSPAVCLQLAPTWPAVAADLLAKVSAPAGAPAPSAP